MKSPAPPQSEAPQRIVVQVPPPGAGGGAGSPSALYEGFRNQRQELRDQLDRLEDQREELQEQLTELPLVNPARKGIEQRITAIDQRIAAIDRQIADADAQVARAAAIPGAIMPDPPEPPRGGPPEEAWVLGGLFIVVVLLPISIAFARRIWRRSAAAVAALPKELHDRFARVEQSIDAIAVEVERIGEGQRFLTRMHAEQRGLTAGGREGERVEVPGRADPDPRRPI